MTIYSSLFEAQMDSGYTLGFFRTQEESVSPSQYQFGIVDIEYNEGVHGIQ